MKLEDIHAEWEKDSKIDRSDLVAEHERIYQLHSKWGKIASAERLLLRKYEYAFKKMVLIKREWLLTGETKETRDLGWEFPARGKPMRDDFKFYMDADREMQEAGLQVDAQKEKVEVLNDIQQMIRYRSNLLRSMIEAYKIQMGIQ